MLPEDNKRQTKTRLYSTLAVLVLVPLFAGLGYWQLQRAAEKEAIIAQRAKADERTPIIVESMQAEQALHLQKVRLKCALNFRHQLLMDNRVYQQQVGFEVITVCEFSDGTAVLVNRGWVKAGLSREQLPDVTINAAISATISESLDGIFAIPGAGLRLGAALTQGDTAWPRLIQHYDFAAIGSLLSRPLMVGVVYLDEGSPLVTKHSWKPIAFGPTKHYGYAFQWFALMATLVLLYSFFNFSKRKSREK